MCHSAAQGFLNFKSDNGCTWMNEGERKILPLPIQLLSFIPKHFASNIMQLPVPLHAKPGHHKPLSKLQAAGCARLL